MKSFLLALSFLTIIPIKLDDINEELFKKSLYYFIFIGFIIGFFLYLLSNINFNIEIKSFFLLFCWILFSGGFHIDGLADTFDSLAYISNKEKALSIMKDSSVGVYGAISIVLLLLGKYLLIKNLIVNNKNILLILAPLWGRFGIVFMGYKMKYLREVGIGKVIVENIDKKLFNFSIFIAIILSIFFGIFFKIIIILTFLYFIKKFFYIKLKGVTGDILGATVETTELLTLFLVFF